MNEETVKSGAKQRYRINRLDLHERERTVTTPPGVSKRRKKGKR